MTFDHRSPPSFLAAVQRPDLRTRHSLHPVSDVRLDAADFAMAGDTFRPNLKAVLRGAELEFLDPPMTS